MKIIYLLLLLAAFALSAVPATAVPNSICTDGDIVTLEGIPEELEIFFGEEEVYINTSWILFDDKEEVNIISTVPVNYGIVLARSIKAPIRMKFNQGEFPWTLLEAEPLGIPTGFSEKQFPWITETVRIYPPFHFSPRKLKREGVERLIMS